MHSDRGSQFTSEAYNQVTANMTLSYSKKAYPTTQLEFTVTVDSNHQSNLKMSIKLKFKI